MIIQSKNIKLKYIVSLFISIPCISQGIITIGQNISVSVVNAFSFATVTRVFFALVSARLSIWDTVDDLKGGKFERDIKHFVHIDKKNKMQ